MIASVSNIWQMGISVKRVTLINRPGLLLPAGCTGIFSPSSSAVISQRALARVGKLVAHRRRDTQLQIEHRAIARKRCDLRGICEYTARRSRLGSLPDASLAGAVKVMGDSRCAVS